MSYYIIIRGPLGCGKSTVAEALSKKLKAKHFAIDRILDKYNIEEWEEGYVSQKSFIKANEIASNEAKELMKKGIPVIFDGNFYHKSQIDDLIARLKFPHYIFTLKAPLEECIKRDKERYKTHGKDAAEAVYRKSTSFGYGITIDTTNQTSRETVKEILTYLPKTKKIKVLCVCAVGANRSKYLASYLRKLGYSARFGGIDYREEEKDFKPVTQKEVDWADRIIIVRKRLESIFKLKFKSKGKKIIVLNITDSKRRIPKEFNHLKELEYKEFQNKWTYPQLRKAIKKYLPL